MTTTSCSIIACATTVRSKLREFCDGRSTWPSADEFKTAGLGPLYFAASLQRGIRYRRAVLEL